MTKKMSSQKTVTVAAELIKELLTEAKRAQKNSYSPYSGYKIGASVLMADGQIYGGANIENASYGATVCAERTAIWTALIGADPKDKKADSKLVDVVCVVSSSKEAWPPCGMCRQVISEFGHAETVIITQGQEGPARSYKFKDLFPEGFDPKFLQR